MDIIVENYFKKFIKEQSIIGTNKEVNFEKFINYICLASKNINNFNLSATCVGSGCDAGIDGIAIAINNRYVSDMAELKLILDMGMEFSAEFIFIQAKTSESFECKEIANFGDGVTDLFRGEDAVKKIMNENVADKYKMIREIINNYEYANSLNCNLYYVTPGKYVEDNNLLSTKTRIKESIEALGIFDHENINIIIGDKNFIRKEYEKTKVQNSATFELNSKIEIPYMEKVEEAYFAIMPIKEYLKIVIDESGRIRSGIFELNVRDFAGIDENRVNQDIVRTLDADDKSKFGLLNNGITIVGKSLSKGQGKYTIKNFYIVNGCQTTNVLSENFKKIKNDMWISVKIVITQNDDIIRDIVKATNNQTEVEEIQLLSMDEYQEELESYFNSYDKYTKLFYERRDGQYRGNPEADIIKIVNPEMQIKCFASIFLNLPHVASRFYGKLLEEISKKIFVKDQLPIIYYTAALLNYHIERAFINDEIEQNYNKFKYHLETIIAHLVLKNEKKPQLNSNQMEKYCEILIIAVEDDIVFSELLTKAKECIDKVVRNISDTEANKTLGVVNELLLYSETEWTQNDINEVMRFEEIIYFYLIPFINMSVDGDLRYNFEKNLDYLNQLIKDSKAVADLIEKEFFNEIYADLDENIRKNRKENAKKICNRIEEIRDLLQKKINIAKKYKIQNTI